MGWGDVTDDQKLLPNAGATPAPPFKVITVHRDVIGLGMVTRLVWLTSLTILPSARDAGTTAKESRGMTAGSHPG